MLYKNSTVIVVFIILFCLMNPANGLAAEPVASDPNTIQTTDPNQSDYNVIENINPEDVRLLLNFKDAPVSDILDYLSQAAGLVIVADSYPEGRINLVSKQPLKIDDVVSLINTVLKEKGYAAIRTERTLKLVNIEQAKYSNIPVTSGNDPDKIPEGDEIITHIIPIRYANAVKLKDDVSSLISQDAVLSSNEASNSLIITDTTSNIKRLVRIIKAVDTQMAGITDVRVFRLVYADAENTADLINTVFNTSENQTSSRSNRNQNPFFMRFGRRGPGGQEESDQQGAAGTPAISVPVVASADDRTNSVVVSGSSDILNVIATVVKELDSNPTEKRSIFVYKLKYAQAANIKEELNNMFQQLQSLNNQMTNGRNSGGARTGNISARSSQSNDLSEETYVEADTETNSLLIMTSAKNYDQIKAVIDSLDVSTPQVLIKVLIAELTTTDGTDIGVEWSVLNNRDSGGSNLNKFEYSPKPTEGFTSQIIEGDLTATLRALQETGKLNILSRPYIMTSNNQVATINVGQRYPFITTSQITDTGNVNNTVDYRDIGITLEVTPNINNDGVVIMDVNPQIITALADTVKLSDNVDATVFATRAAQCRVAVPNGKTVVIGGLMEDDDTKNSEKIPILGDLPLLGGLFKRTKIDKEKTELLIFLTPQVANRIEDIEKISDHERSKSEFLNEKADTPLQKQVQNMESVYSK